MTPDIGSAAELPIDVDGIRAYSEMVHSLRLHLPTMANWSFAGSVKR